MERKEKSERSEQKAVDRCKARIKLFKSRSVYKLLLGSVSTVFKEMFFNKNYEETKDGAVVVKDSTPEAFEIMLKYIYCGLNNSQLTHSMNTSEVEAISRLFNVLELAEKYQVGDIVDKCKYKLINSIIVTEENLFNVVSLASNTHFEDLDRDLKKMGKKFLTEKIKEHGFEFVQTLMNQPNYKEFAFNELCRTKEKKSNAGETSSLDDSGISTNNDSILSPSGLKKGCWLM